VRPDLSTYGARTAPPATGRVEFTRPFVGGSEVGYVEEAVRSGRLAGGGEFARRCAEWLQERTDATRALPTPSCTAALEMAALLARIEPGDEVIMPSWTFVSTALAFVLRGATPVWVDVRPDTLNLDELLVEDAITPRTRAIVPVHYAGVGCEMDALLAIAARHRVLVIEDAAHGVCAAYRGRPLGAIGDLGCLSFDVQKNLTCGEGGALLLRDPGLLARAEVLHAKGTNRAAFQRGDVAEYAWTDLGSSWKLSEISAAFLLGQLEDADAIQRPRMRVWSAYHEALAPLEARGVLRRPSVPAHCSHNAHLYWVTVAGRERRDALIAGLAARGITAAFHYVPLHTSPAGRRYGRPHGDLPVTDRAGECLVRLPVWSGMSDAQVEQVVDGVFATAA